MKIKKLTKHQISNWIEKNVPDDLTLLNFTEMFQSFQDAVVKINLTPKKFVNSVRCLNCGKVHKANTLKLLDIQYYVPPFGCTGGAYWTHSEYAIKCEDCGHMLTIPDYALWSPQPVMEEVCPPSNHTGFIHRDCVINYKTIYV